MEEYFKQNSVKPCMMTGIFNSAIPLTKDISHDVETNAMSDNTLCFQLFYLAAFMSDRDRMVVRFITTYAICAYHH
jgi:hypothetical protein